MAGSKLLGHLKTAGAVPARETGLNDDSEQVRVGSSVALAGIGIATEKVLRQLIGGLKNHDLMVRKDCEEALQEIDRPAIPLLVECAAGHAIDGPRDNTEPDPIKSYLL